MNRIRRTNQHFNKLTTVMAKLTEGHLFLLMHILVGLDGKCRSD